jgi:tripartite-type tricarboxylate transporter receptor subunit TctC
MMRLLPIIALLLYAAPASAEDDVAAFYRGKQVHLIVGSAAGSGYDINARAFAHHFGDHIPGKPAVIVQNQPGAGSLIMTNALANTAARDGTIIGAAINGMPTAPLLQPEGARFDPTKLTWIGSSNKDTQVLYVWHTAPVKTLLDLRNTELIVGATSPGTSMMDFPLVTGKILGLKFKIVSGYEGTAQIHKAMEAGEVQGVAALAWSSLKAVNADWITDGKIRILAQWSEPSHPDLTAYPSVISIAKSDADRQALLLLTSRLDVGRPFVAPPDIPAARADALRRAFDETMRDPAYLSEAEKLKLDVAPVTGAEVAALVTRVLATPPEVVARVRAALDAKQ